MKTKKTILIADADPGYLVALRFFFEESGWIVILAQSLAAVKRAAPRADVLLIDPAICWSGTGSADAIANVSMRKVLPASIPVVFFSALSENEYAEVLKPLRKRCDWIRKPTALEVLDETVRSSLLRRQQTKRRLLRPSSRAATGRRGK